MNNVQGVFTAWICAVQWIISHIGIQIDLILIPDRIGLQEPPSRLEYIRAL